MRANDIRRTVLFLILLPMILSAQVQHDVAQLTSWTAPLYWQPTEAEKRMAPVKLLAADNLIQSTTPANSLVFVGMTPCRVIDTRTGSGFTGPFGQPALIGGDTRTFPIQSSTTCSIPAIAQAYSFNITMIPSGFVDFITVWPTGQSRPNASTLNGYVGTVIANAAIVAAGLSGSVDVFASQNTNLIIDINGYYAPQSGLTLGQGAASSPSLSFSGDPGTGLFSAGTGTLNMATGGSNRLTVTSDGNVGIGAVPSSSDARLVVQGTSGTGVQGIGALFSPGVHGIAGDGHGVLASSQTGAGVWAGSNGAGLNGPAIRANNSNPSGIGIWSTSSSVDANLVVSNGGAGDLIRGFCATCGDPAFRVLNNGATLATSLSAVSGGMFTQTNGAGLSGPALRANNTNPLGIGIWSTTNSADANLVVTNGGTGDLIRGFCSTCGAPAFRVLNNGTTVTTVLQITGGSDLAEHFEVAEGIEPGMVVAIDPEEAGKLTIARGAHNRKVAGVISGANNLNAGMLLPDPSGSKKSVAVTLTGRVWVYSDASKNPIEPGDLLTTSSIPGHAMKVTNYGKAQGAIIGKAMTGLKSGRGLVLVLATLQ